MGNNSGNGFGFNSGGGGGSDTNTWREVTAGGNTLTGAPSGETLALTAGTSINITESAGEVTISNDAPNVEKNWSTTNMTSLGDNRTMKVKSGGTLALQSNDGTQALKVNDSAEVLIGGASPYTMPTARGTSQYELPFAADGSGTVEWQPPTIQEGGAFLLMSGSVGTFNGSNYAFFKKNGGAMLEVGSLDIGANNVVNLEIGVWDGLRVPTAYRLVALRDGGTAAGVSLNCFFATPSEVSSDVTFTQGADIATDILSVDSDYFQSFSGTIGTDNYDGMAAGDFYTFGVQCLGDEMTGTKYWLSIYYSTLVKY